MNMGDPTMPKADFYIGMAAILLAGFTTTLVIADALGF
jgi:hypothetical protein